MQVINYVRVLAGAGGTLINLPKNLYIMGIDCVGSAGSPTLTLCEGDEDVSSWAACCKQAVLKAYSANNTALLAEPIHLHEPKLKLYVSAGATVSITLFVADKQSKLYPRS